MAVFFEFYEAKDNFIYDLAFYRRTLLYMQQDQGNEESECIDTFDDFIELMNQIFADTESSDDYYAGLAAKGQGAGTEYGFMIEKGQRYIDAAIFGVNVFNYCDLDYYLVSLGKSLGSASGAVNQFTNLFWRFFSTEDQLNYYNMSVGITENDTDAVGAAMGNFISALLTVEVPDTTTTSSYQPVGQLI